MKKVLTALIAVLVLAVAAAWWFWPRTAADPTDNNDRPESDFPEIAADVMAPMDNGLKLSPDAVLGRNSWDLWTAGDEQFWDHMARESLGLVDLLKTIDSRKRAQRFTDLGMIDQPGMKQADAPDQYGLWLDQTVTPEAKEIDPKVYGRPTGVMGLRLFDNPDFDAAAKARWDGKRYYEDEKYFTDSGVIRPYRVGMACGFCHIAFSPLKPPADPANPTWENLVSAIGNQYFREGRIFAQNLKPGDFMYEMIETQPPGTSDTSRVATDHINNPNVMNAIFLLAAREQAAGRHVEKMAGGALDLLPHGDTRAVPHILKDGADSVGVPGATIRVYINIGMFHQQWLTCHNVMVGLTQQKPFDVSKARKNSVFWRVTESRLGHIAQFFRELKPWHLADAPGGDAFLSKDAERLKRGKLAFADSCAECHSSKQPPDDVAKDAAKAQQWYRDAVLKDDFLVDNFLSTDDRIAVTKLGTNCARAMATNATAGHVWDNFSSQTYKDLPAVGAVSCWNPADPEHPYVWQPPGGGRGYYRVPSLIGIWFSAPFLHNNALGIFTGDPSVAGRMKAFDDAAEKLLWPEKRLGAASVWRTANVSSVRIPIKALPAPLHPLCNDGVLTLGPIPKGTPINLVANIDPEADKGDLVKLALELQKTMAKIKVEHLDDDDAKALMRQEVVPLLMKVSKCPDFIEDRGHEYGSELPDDDKRALIEYLKTL